MDQEQAIAFLLFALVAAITPGPSNVLLTATGANAGIVRGLPCLLGVSLGMGFMMFLVAFGLGSVVLGSPKVLRALNWGGVAFLLWLSWKIATAGRSAGSAKADPIGFFGAAAFQWINPKSWLVSASAAGTYLHADAGSAFAQSLTFGLLFIVAAAPSCFVWLAFGAGVQRLLHSETALRAFNIAMGAILAGSAILFVW